MSSVFSAPNVSGALLACVLGISSLASAQIAASKADTSEEAVVFDRLDNLVRYEDDGTGMRETTAVIRVQSQAGVQELGQLVLGYSSATEKLDVDYVRVRKPNGQVIETPASSAQDFAPEILRQAPMYSDYRQRHVSVANLQAGDILEYHTVTHVTTPLAPHQFWYEHSFSEDVAIREEKLEINVPKGRALKLKSPDHKYETQEAGDRRIYVWTIHDRFPDRKHERDADRIEPDFTPDVQISTFADWPQVAHWYAQLQGERVVVDDAVRQKANELTRGATTAPEKARRLYDFVALNIRYVSISFGVGRLQPHAASEVLQNGFGDCKDKHTLLQAMLRAEGIQSYPVLISSYREIDPEIPSPAQFDHEITAVELGGELTWLDSTAGVAPYGLILYQLRNKQALLAADGKLAGLQRTPANSLVKNQLSIKIDGNFTETGSFDSKIEITASGDSDVMLRAAFRSLPQARWPDALKNVSAMLGLAGEVSDTNLDSLEDTSKPLHIAYRIHKDNYFSVPTAGVSFWTLPGMSVPHLAAADPKKPRKPLNVGPMIDETYRAHLQFAPNYAVQVPTMVRMSRDYGEFAITYQQSKNVLDMEFHLALKVNELPASRRSDYESFESARNGLRQVLNASVRPASAEALSAAAKVNSGTPEELHKAGIAALQRRDFSNAAELLKRSLEADPKQKDAWDELGRAYSSLGEHEQAISAFRKQIEIDAFHKSANQDLGLELQETGKLTEAIAAYRKQLEITPFNKTALKSLGLLLAEQNQDAEAIRQLEAAAATPPSDPEVNVALARLYARNGDTAKSEVLLKSTTGVASLASGTDLYTTALRDDIDPNKTWREARNTLDDIGDQFDSGEFDHPGPSVFQAMNLVSLAWARIGWSKYLQGDNMEAMSFLNSAWLLSQAGTIQNRMAQVLEKEGQKGPVRHALALACAAGGSEAAASREKLMKLSPAPEAEKEIVDATAELLKMRTVKLPRVPVPGASAQFALTFDGSSKPQRVDWLDGSPELRTISARLQEEEYPVRFPETSSVRIVHRATVSCDGTGCSLVLQPLKDLQGEPGAAPPPKAASAAKN